MTFSPLQYRLHDFYFMLLNVPSSQHENPAQYLLHSPIVTCSAEISFRGVICIETKLRLPIRMEKLTGLTIQSRPSNCHTLILRYSIKMNLQIYNACHKIKSAFLEVFKNNYTNFMMSINILFL